MADEFCLLSHDTATKFAIVLDDMRMSFKRYTPSRSVFEYVNNEMRGGQIPTLPIDRSLIKQYIIGTGSTDLSHFNLTRRDQLPEQIIICVVEQSAYNGNIKMNPFNFQHFNIREASLIVMTTQKVGPVNDIFHSLWSKVTVKINDVEIGDSTSTWYAYKAYLENHLSYSKVQRRRFCHRKDICQTLLNNLMMLGVRLLVLTQR